MSFYPNETMIYKRTLSRNNTDKKIFLTVMSEFLFILESSLLSVYNGLKSEIQIYLLCNT